tara:strand:- start:774 stop:2273 length:1500 start_codon:yes stop_codon:yes gene_type:complete
MINNIINDFKIGKINIYQAVSEIDQYRNESKRKSEGVVYTPKYIADSIIEGINYNINETLLEPSVGHGIFIFSLIEYVEEKFNLNKKELKEWFESKIYGIDINEENIKDLKLLLVAYFDNKDINISTDNFIVGDGLFTNILDSYDCIIGNPPYIRTKNLETSYLKKLRENYNSMEKGNVDIYYAFIEHAWKNAKKSSYIVPNSYIYNKSAKSLREIVLNDIVSVIDFKNTLIFDNASTYTSIFNINKNQKNDKILYKNKLEEDFQKIDKEKLNNNQWIFNDFNQGENKIENYCKIKSGIATLKDKIYIIENPIEIEYMDKKYIKHTYNKKEYLIEKELTVDFYKITKLNKEYRIIYPYDDKLNIIKEENLNNNYPFAYKFLKECRVDLDARDKGKVDKYESWYAYGRKQGLSNNNKNYYLLIPLMISKGFKCKTLIEPQHFLFASGFVLEFEKENDLNLIKDILESDKFYNFIKQQGKPWAGKKEYFSFTTTLLKTFKF